MIPPLLRPVVVGGSPGCGKTTLCRELARSAEKGVHLETDTFFDFIAQKIDPSHVDSKDQNVTVVKAYCAAARVYADGGYSVFIDGVIGPWLLPQLRAALGAFDYVLLHAPLDETLRRIESRAGQPSASEGVVRRMHPQFEAALGDWRNNVLHTDQHTAAELVELALAKIAAGAPA